MANNSQLSYQTATIDPTVAGYAAKDPGFALGLLLGRAWVDNYNARGERKLRESLTNKDGSMKTDGTDGTQNTSSATATGTTEGTGTQGTDAESTEGEVTEKPQIFAVNENPVMTAVPKYTIDPNGGSQPLTAPQRAVMESAISGAQPIVQAVQSQAATQSATPQADTPVNSLKDRAYAILHDPNNAWSQSAQRGAMYNQLAAMGEPGNGNPYAIGNYDDPTKNYSNQSLFNAMQGKYDPTYAVNNGVVAENSPTGYTGANPLQGMSNYAINTGTTNPIQGTDFSGMNLAQLNSYLNGEAPQSTPILNAVQGAQQQNALNTQQNLQPNNTNFSDAEQDKNSAPVQKDDKQGTTEDVSKTETTEPTVAQNATVQSQPSIAQNVTVQPQSVVAQNATTPQVGVANNATPIKPVQLPTIQTANGSITPFRTQDWISRVTQAGLAQGRPMNQIQNVIAQTMPMAQAAEENYVKAATNALADRIFRGDVSTGGNPLIPNGVNDNVVIPQLLSTLQQMDQINPEYADKIRNILPGAKDVWGQNRGDINKARDVKYAEQMADQSMKNNITQHEAYANIDLEKLRKQYAMKSDADKQKILMAYQMYVNAGYSPKEATIMAMGGGSRSSGTGTKTTGGVQKAANGNNVINGNTLTNTQQARANELDNYLTKLMHNLTEATQGATEESIKASDGEHGDNLAQAIDKLSTYYDSLEDKDKALIPEEVDDQIKQLLYYANYRREYLAGNTKNAAQYLAALTPEARKAFNIYD